LRFPMHESLFTSGRKVITIPFNRLFGFSALLASIFSALLASIRERRASSGPITLRCARVLVHFSAEPAAIAVRELSQAPTYRRAGPRLITVAVALVPVLFGRARLTVRAETCDG